MKLKSKNVLIVCRDFPPYGGVTSHYIRMLELANFLCNKDCIVNVYCISRTYKLAKESLDPRVIVHPIKSVYTYFDIVGCVLNKPASKFVCYATKAFKRLYLKFKKNIIDYESIMTGHFYNRILSDLKGVENANLITSSPSHSIHLVGELLKDSLDRKINWIADFRDPWTPRPLYNIKKTAEVEFEKKVEARFLKKADHFVVVSEGMANYYKKLRHGCVKLIENGYIDTVELKPNSRLVEFVTNQHKAGRIVLAYFGAGGIGFGGQSGKDLRFLGDCLAERADIFNKFSLVMQGSIAINKHNWGDRLLVLDSEELSQARANMRVVDIGLNVYTCVEDADMTIGSKVYELAASNTPIWCLIPNNAKSIQSFAKKVEGVLITDPLNKAQVINDAEKIISHFGSGKDYFKINKSELVNYKRSSQYKKFLELLQ